MTVSLDDTYYLNNNNKANHTWRSKFANEGCMNMNKSKQLKLKQFYHFFSKTVSKTKQFEHNTHALCLYIFKLIINICVSSELGSRYLFYVT